MCVNFFKAFANPISLLLLLVLLCSCSSLFYLPSKEVATTPAEIGLPYEPISLVNHDEPTLSAWFLPSNIPSAPTVLFLHGNAGNMGSHLASVYWLPHEGFNVFMFDYRGYGSSQGSASLEGAHRDILRAVDYLRSRQELTKHGLILYGQSLGATMALSTAARPELHDVFSTIVAESPFASYSVIAAEKAALLWLTYPFQWLVRLSISDAYSPNRQIEGLRGPPILLIAGGRDQTVPQHHTEQIYTLLDKNPLYWVYPEADHLGIFQSADRRKRLARYFEKATKSSDR